MSESLQESKFLEIFAQFQKPIRRYIGSLIRDSGEAEDLTQETFLRAYRNLSSLRDRKTLASWLFRIATNLCYDRFRHSASRPKVIDSIEERDGTKEFPDEEHPRLDSVFDRKEMGACVQSYLEDLPDDYRAVIMLHDLEGLTNPEIAAMLDCSLATAKIRLHRARRRLKTALGRACDFSVDERGVTVCQPKASDREQDQS